MSYLWRAAVLLMLLDAGWPQIAKAQPASAMASNQYVLSEHASSRSTDDLSFRLDSDGTLLLARSDRTVFQYGRRQVVRFRLRRDRADDAIPWVVLERFVPARGDEASRVELLAYGQPADDVVYEIPGASEANDAVLRVRTFAPRPLTSSMRTRLETYRDEICRSDLPALRRAAGLPQAPVDELARACAAPATSCDAMPPNAVGTSSTGSRPLRRQEQLERAQAVMSTARYVNRLLECPNETLPWGIPLGTFELPLSTGRVALLRWEAGGRSIAVRAHEIVDVMLVGVPHTTRVHLSSTSQAQPRAHPLELLGQFARVVFGGLSQLSGGGSGPVFVLPDASVPTLNLSTSRAYSLRAGDGEVRTFSFCSSLGCRGDTTRNQLTLTPGPGSGLTLMLDVSWMLPYDATHDEHAYSYDRYVAVGGPYGPDQLFQVQNDLDVRDHFVVSLLLAWRQADAFGDRDLFVGVGPTLVDLHGARAFRDVHLRLGVEVFDYFYLSLGVSVGAVERRLASGYPEMLSVPRASPVTTPDAPTPPLDTSVVLGFGVGIAIDLGVTGAAVKEVTSALQR
ncbi:MAG: hypothetical protein RLP09_34370 [Sandaracinaceae bacterium]